MYNEYATLSAEDQVRIEARARALRARAMADGITAAFRFLSHLPHQLAVFVRRSAHI